MEHLVNAYSFERAYGKLMSVERTLIAESSKPMIQCMEDVKDQQFQMYYRYATFCCPASPPADPFPHVQG